MDGALCVLHRYRSGHIGPPLQGALAIEGQVSQGVLLGEGQTLGEWPDQGAGPTIHSQVSGSEEDRTVHALTTKTPACTTPRAENMRKKRRHAQRAPVFRPPAGAILPFLFWTVHGPFVSGLRAAASRRLASGTRLRAQSLFLLEGKLGPRAACRVGRGGRNGAERSPRR